MQVLFIGLAPSAGCQAASANNSSLAVILFSLITSVDSRVVCSLSLCTIDPGSAPSKAYCLHSLTIGVTSGSIEPAHAFLQYAFGGDVGHCPRVQHAFTWKDYTTISSLLVFCTTQSSPSGENLCRFTGASISGCAELELVKFSPDGSDHAFTWKELQQFLYCWYSVPTNLQLLAGN